MFNCLLFSVVYDKITGNYRSLNRKKLMIIFVLCLLFCTVFVIQTYFVAILKKGFKLSRLNNASEQ